MRCLAAFLGLAAALAFAPHPAAAETIKLATLAPAGSPWHDALLDMGEAWKDLSGGRVTLKIYAGGVAGDESDMVRKMRIGQLQAATLSAGGLPDIAPEFRALQLPMMFRSYEELDYVRDRIDEEGASGEVAELYAQVVDPKSGAVDNILKIHSLNPAGLRAHFMVYAAAMAGTPGLRKVDREMIALVVSGVNECHY